MDQANREEVNTIFRQIINDFQTVDILINVAGIISAKPFSDLSPEEWDQTIQTNLTGPFNTVKAIWEHFKNNTSMNKTLSDDPIKNEKVISMIPLGRAAEP